MKAKLIKLELHDGYRLDDENGLLIASTLESSKNKLSLKNCQAIERGYDLYELAKENYHKFWSVVDESEMLNHTFGYVEGFQKALELMGDKKFSEEDMVSAYRKGESSRYSRIGEAVLQDEFIQSLKQTEWDCIIFVDEKTNKPLLDSEGNLILKRK